MEDGDIRPGPAEPPALRLGALRVPFGASPGLQPIDLSVARGERLVLVGASGEGKTSLLRAVAGLAPISGGSVWIDGTDRTLAPAERRGAVYLRQTPLLFPHLTVGENVAFPLRVRGVPAAEVRTRVAAALNEVRLADRADRRPETLSGGEAQRVALARATVARPALLLLDEPLSALDPSLRHEVRTSIIRLAEAYRPGLVMVTHDLDEAGVLAHRIGVLVHRRLEQVAPPAELFRRPATPAVARFLGVPNLVPGRVTENGIFRGEGDLVLVDAGVPPGAAVATFRPGALRAHPEGEIAGTVVGHLHRSYGHSSQVRVAGRVLEWSPDPYAMPAVGDEVRLRLDPRGVVVYPSEGDSPIPTA